jgi:hypothetical protein
MNAVWKKMSGVLQILKNTIEKKISGALQIMHLELTFSRGGMNTFEKVRRPNYLCHLFGMLTFKIFRQFCDTVHKQKTNIQILHSNNTK